MITLSERLRSVAGAVPLGGRLADVGTDHALLPIYLVQRDLVNFAIATDVAKGPCEAARLNVLRHNLTERISVRIGDGLQSVTPGEIDVVAIAGMGGHTARAILEGAPDVVKQLQRIIVQPMNASYHVREFLYQNGFVLASESILKEDGRYYELVVGDKSKVQSERDRAYQPFCEDPLWMDLAFEFGPTLLQTPSRLFFDYLKETVRSWAYVTNQMSKSTTQETVLRVQELTKKSERMSEWFALHGESTS